MYTKAMPEQSVLDGPHKNTVSTKTRVFIWIFMDCIKSPISKPYPVSNTTDPNMSLQKRVEETESLTH